MPKREEKRKTEDLVAQLVEHDTFNVGVTGSSPVGVTKADIRSAEA